MADYGTDLSLLSALPALFPTISGAQVVVQAVYRRWTTDPASEAGRRAYGSQCRHLQHLLAARVDQAILSGWERDLAEIAKQDDRVDDCTVSIDMDRTTKKLVLKGSIRVGKETVPLVIPFDVFDPQVLDATA